MPLGHRRAMSLNFSIKTLTRLSFLCLVSCRIGMIMFEPTSKNRAKKRLSRSLNVLMNRGESFLNQLKAKPLGLMTKSLIRIVSLMEMFPF